MSKPESDIIKRSVTLYVDVTNQKTYVTEIKELNKYTGEKKTEKKIEIDIENWIFWLRIYKFIMELYLIKKRKNQFGYLITL